MCKLYVLFVTSPFYLHVLVLCPSCMYKNKLYLLVYVLIIYISGIYWLLVECTGCMYLLYVYPSCLYYLYALVLAIVLSCVY